jgi:hypothetical protein
MAASAMMLTIKQSWWVMPYINAVVLLSQITGLEPDYDKVANTALKGISIKAVDSR